MTEKRHRDLQRANIPNLNITDWIAPSSQEMRSQEPEDISPRSRDDANLDIPILPSRPDNILSSTTEEDVKTNITTPVPPSKLMRVEPISRPELLSEIRKIFQEEGYTLFIEGIKKLTQFSETQSISSVSSAAGSVISSPSLDQSHTFIPGATTSGTTADETAATRRTVRFSDRHVFPIRPSRAIRTTSSSQSSADWGQLFDDNGYATLRLGQVLRGIAKHIIDDYTPKNSLVITPEKLANFYMKYRLETEVYPFMDIFTSKAGDANERLGDFYDDLECQHHLVQKYFHSRPSLPALTPIGFAQYLTICILAYPDEEFRRLERIIAETTLTADTMTRNGQPERLPKTIFRSCLPAKYDLKNRKLLDSAIDDLMYDLSLQNSDSRMKQRIVPGSEKRGVTRVSVDPARRESQGANTTGEDQRVVEYDVRGEQKRFPPGGQQIIGDEAVVDSSHGWGPTREYNPKGVGNVSTAAVSNDSAKLQSGNSQYLASSPNTFYSSPPVPQRPSLSGPGARPELYSQSRASFSPKIPPPPIGPHASITSNLTSSSRRLRSPQRRSHSASVPNVSTNIGSPSSSTAVFTPSSHSSTSISPTAEHGALTDLPHHYQNHSRDLRDHSTHQVASMAQQDNHYPYQHRSSSNLENAGAGLHNNNNNNNDNNNDIQQNTGRNGSEQTDAAWAVKSPNLERRLETRASQRHQHSAPSVESVSETDEHGITWGEYLKGQQEKGLDQNQKRAIGYHGDR